ncbi:PREDICTED: N-alpha-acetyltransferase 38, NatC auxiliary subunit [Papilio xuthus]|uniref:LSM domain-containing protein 1-A n=1 Tax=Papilio xuthus TaxID=66420 RepID=A0A194PHP6_PAPXU|nr:PREDICTED: N-alpha-acetyltransferase 38, NatC auxiliary subunit [Papilio xuthus]KPI92568.1 LSM domain-containing protein 1-A [Papilio xuthus]
MSSTAMQTTEIIKDNGEIDGKSKLRKWLNMNFRIEMTDGRVLIGVFLCTDRDANVILGACSEYLKSNDGETEEPRVLGLVMVPGRHIVSIKIDETMDTSLQKFYYEE